jgi:hypothetical protein
VKEKLMAVQTDDGDQKTTKLERIGKRASFKKETVFNNIGHVVDLDLLHECYRELDGKKAIGIDGVLKRNRCSQLTEMALSGAGCGKSARPVLRRGLLG